MEKHVESKAHKAYQPGVARLPDTHDQTLSCDGFRFPYRILHGDDPDRIPVLFLGGAFQSMNSWKRFVSVFHPERTVLLVDLPGMGQADFLPESYGLDFFRALCERCLMKSVARRCASSPLRMGL